MPIRAVLVENLERPHRIYRRYLENIDDVQVIGAYYNPEKLLEALDSGLRPDVIVMDVRMDESLDGSDAHGMDGITAARVIRQRFLRMPIALYSMWDNNDYYRRIEEARLGTRYAFVKRYSLDNWDRLGEIIRQIVQGGTYIDPEVRIEMELMGERRANSPLDLLDNDEQRKVLKLLADGFSNEEIAAVVERKPRWVEEEVKKIYAALQLTAAGGSDSRRIRAARIFHEDRVLQWNEQAGGRIVIEALDRWGTWRPLDDIKREEQEALEDAIVINNATP